MEPKKFVTFLGSWECREGTGGSKRTRKYLVGSSGVAQFGGGAPCLEEVVGGEIVPSFPPGQERNRGQGHGYKKLVYNATLSKRMAGHLGKTNQMT